MSCCQDPPHWWHNFSFLSASKDKVKCMPGLNKSWLKNTTGKKGQKQNNQSQTEVNIFIFFFRISLNLSIEASVCKER